MNQDNQRLKEIQEFKKFYKSKINEAETELESDMLQVQFNKLEEEEKEILKRFDVII